MKVFLTKHIRQAQRMFTDEMAAEVPWIKLSDYERHAKSCESC
jgi:hypothetical protein